MFIVIIFVIGVNCGSFINCLVWRLHAKKTILGRSFCPQCRKQINWYDNIPLLSFLLLKAKCRYCRQSISWQYPLVEAATAIIFILIWYSYYPHSQFSNFQILRDWIFAGFLIVIFIYDLRWYEILDTVTIPAMVIAFIFNLWLGASFWSLLLAALIGGGFFLGQFLISQGRWIGGGDIRLGALMGLMLGYPQVVVALMIAYLSGSVVGAGLLVAKKKQWSSQIPFGTFLSLATIIAMLWGSEILSWYLNFL